VAEAMNTPSYTIYQLEFSLSLKMRKISFNLPQNF